MRPWRTVGYSAPQPSQCVTAGSVSIFSAARGSSSGPLYRPVPAADQLMRDGAADLAELERDGRDVRQLLLAADPLDGADDVKYNAQLVHITSSSARRA